MTIIETMRIRKSCRTYSNRPIEPEKITELRQFLATNTETPFGGKVRFHLMDFNEMNIGELKNLTTYGVIKGARQFIIGTAEKQPKSMEDYGYCLEKIILKSTSMGLGTCMLGGTFKRGGFAEKINLGESELLPVISPVGYPSERRSIIDRTFRFVASSDKRKPRNELFYLHGIDTVALSYTIEASNLWSFFQAKTIRMTTVRTAAEAAETELKHTNVPGTKAILQERIESWKKTAARYDSEPETQEGRKELMVRAKAAENKRTQAMAAYHHYELASAALQIAIVLASAEIITGVAALTWISGGLGVIGLLFGLIGFFAPMAIHLF